ncbi:MAG: hypothetical protein NUV54_00070 [Candidatus Taylorbacteria bacterium]|nr:hypothetical protein [Candidatus Taylorbacteria bacterium]
MLKLKLLAAPDRFGFARSFFQDTDGLTFSKEQGGHACTKQDPSSVASEYRGEIFVVQEGEKDPMQIPLVVTAMERLSSTAIKFETALYANCNEYRSWLWDTPLSSWVYFNGIWSFTAGQGELKQFIPK